MKCLVCNEELKASKNQQFLKHYLRVHCSMKYVNKFSVYKIAYSRLDDMKDRAIKNLRQYIQFPDHSEFTGACYKPALIDFLSRDKGQAWVCALRTGPKCIGELKYTDGKKKLNLIIMFKPFCSESY